MDYWRRCAGRLRRRGPPRFLGVSPQTPSPLRVPLLPLTVIISLRQILWRAALVLVAPLAYPPLSQSSIPRSAIFLSKVGRLIPSNLAAWVFLPRARRHADSIRLRSTLSTARASVSSSDD